MAQVYEAVLLGAQGFRRRVAVKRILPQHAHDPALRRMFFDEARVASSLHHGGIVQVLDYGIVDGAQFITMEYVDGVDASRATRQGAAAGSPIPPGVALYIVSEVAYALQHAHTRTDPGGAPLGIVHRDVSPQNILLSWEGDVKLSDFGIAKAVARQEKTNTGVIKGKVFFMAPEQAAGQGVTASADIYALGRTLEVLLRGRPDGGQPPAADAPAPEVAALLERCQAADPGARPSSAELAETAARLAYQALGRDGRGGLREWLSSIREDLTRRSVLDEVIGLSLVAVGQREFTVSKDGRLTRPVTSMVDPEASTVSGDAAAPLEDQSTVMERPPRPAWRWRGPALAFAGLAALSGALYAGWPLSGPSSAKDASPASDVRSLVALRAPPDAAGTAPPDASRQAPPDLSSAPDVAPRTAKRRRRRARRSPPAKKKPAARRGWLRVGGATLARGRVEIDGQAVGYAPLERELPVGAHTVVVRDAAGSRSLVNMQVVIDERHTRANALRVIR